MSSFIKNIKGASVPSYAILAGLISVAAIGAVWASGDKVEKIYDLTACEISGSDECSPQDTPEYNEETNAAPEITTTEIEDAKIDVPYEFSFSAEDEASEALSWELQPINDGVIPDGLTFSTSTGTLSGTPTTAGEHSFQIKATDEYGATDIAVLNMTVRDAVRLLTEGPNSVPSAYLGTGLHLTSTKSYLGTGTGTSGYVVAFDNSTGLPLLKFEPSGATSDDFFGKSILEKNGKLFVSAPSDSSTDGSTQTGAVYVFDAETGSQLAKLTPDDPNTEDAYDFSASQAEKFGQAITDAGSYIAVSSLKSSISGTGAVYIIDPSTYETISVVTNTSSSSNNKFGESLAYLNNTLYVGSPFESYDGVTSKGIVFAYDISNASSQDLYTSPDQGISSPINSNAYFGKSIDARNNRLLAGAEAAQTEDVYQSGAAFLFDVSSPTNATLQYTLEPQDPQMAGQMGFAVALTNSRAMVGSINIMVQAKGDIQAFDYSGNYIKTITPFNADADNAPYYGMYLASNGSDTLTSSTEFNYEDDDVSIPTAGAGYLIDQNLDEVTW